MTSLRFHIGVTTKAPNGVAFNAPMRSGLAS
jgi:hypothetical protein